MRTANALTRHHSAERSKHGDKEASVTPLSARLRISSQGYVAPSAASSIHTKTSNNSNGSDGDVHVPHPPSSTNGITTVVSPRHSMSHARSSSQPIVPPLPVVPTVNNSNTRDDGSSSLTARARQRTKMTPRDVFMRDAARHANEWKEAAAAAAAGHPSLTNTSGTSSHASLPGGAILAPLSASSSASNSIGNGHHINGSATTDKTISPELAALSAASMYSGMTAEVQSLRDRVTELEDERHHLHESHSQRGRSLASLRSEYAELSHNYHRTLLQLDHTSGTGTNSNGNSAPTIVKTVATIMTTNGDALTPDSSSHGTSSGTNGITVVPSSPTTAISLSPSSSTTITSNSNSNPTTRLPIPLSPLVISASSSAVSSSPTSALNSPFAPPLSSMDDIAHIDRPASAAAANECGCEPCRDTIPRLRAERNRWRLLHDHKQDNNDRLLAALTEVSTSHRHCGRTMNVLKQQLDAAARHRETMEARMSELERDTQRAREMVLSERNEAQKQKKTLLTELSQAHATKELESAMLRRAIEEDRKQAQSQSEAVVQNVWRTHLTAVQTQHDNLLKVLNDTQQDATDTRATMAAMEEAVKSKAKQKLKKLRDQLAKERLATATALQSSLSMRKELDDLHDTLYAHREFKGKSGDEISSLKSKLFDASTLFDQALASSKQMELEMREVREALRKSEVAQFSEKKGQLDTIAAMAQHETSTQALQLVHSGTLLRTMALSCSQDAVIRTKSKAALREFSRNVNRSHDLPDDLAAAVAAVELIQNWTDRVQASVVEAKVGEVAEQLIRNAKTRLAGLEPLLGCKFTTSTRGADRTEIIQVMPHRAAANAGLREGDVVSEINGHVTPTKERFRAEVSKYHPGDVLTFHVHRGARSFAVEVLAECAEMSMQEVHTLRRIAGGVVYPSDLKTLLNSMADAFAAAEAHSAAAASAVSSPNSSKPSSANHNGRSSHAPSPSIDAQSAAAALASVEHEGKHLLMSRSDVFLGGSCNPTVWRKEIAVPLLTDANVSFYNPQVDNWTPDLVEIEAEAKRDSRVLLFIIDNKTRAMAGMLEAAEYIGSGRRVVLVIHTVQPETIIGGATCSPEEIKDLNRARSYLHDVAKRHGTPCYRDTPVSIRDAIYQCVDIIKGRLPRVPMDEHETL